MLKLMTTTNTDNYLTPLPVELTPSKNGLEVYASAEKVFLPDIDWEPGLEAALTRVFSYYGRKCDFKVLNYLDRALKYAMILESLRLDREIAQLDQGQADLNLIYKYTLREGGLQLTPNVPPAWVYLVVLARYEVVTDKALIEHLNITLKECLSSIDSKLTKGIECQVNSTSSRSTDGVARAAMNLMSLFENHSH